MYIYNIYIYIYIYIYTIVSVWVLYPLTNHNPEMKNLIRSPPFQNLRLKVATISRKGQNWYSVYIYIIPIYLSIYLPIYLSYVYIYIYIYIYIFISGINFSWCHSFTAFKQSKSNFSWLNIKIPHKCLVRKRVYLEKVKKYVSQDFSKICNVEFQKWHFLWRYVPKSHIYVSIHGNNTFQVVKSQKVMAFTLTCNIHW